MKKQYFFYAFCILLLACTKKTAITTDTVVVPTTPPTVYAFAEKPTWSDEFDEDGLPDAKKWDYDVGGHGWGNQELQYYTQADTKNTVVKNGKLIISALKTETGANKYTSARLVTRGKQEWTYGKFEIRAKLPKGIGTWPAIWMLFSDKNYGSGGWPDNGEIDIMEHVGFDQNRVHATVHTKAFYHSIGTQKSSNMIVPDCSEAFHTYSIEWKHNSIEAFIDGKPYFYFDNKGYWEAWPFDHKLYLILNIAIGGGWGGQQGVDDKIFPQTMEIDWVRVYDLQKK